jgi:pyruvate,water dikinase
VPTAPERTGSDPAEPVVDLVDAHAVPAVGAKSAVLSRLLGLGLPVPPGVVVLPHARREQVVAAARDLGPVLAVRSSAADEDSAGSSFAGVLESVLGVAVDDVVDAVAQVRQSVSSPRADAYREARGLTGTATTAVLVQRQVDAVAAGVAFTLDPVSGADVVVVEAASGLGDVVVGGTVDPDRWRVDRAGAVVAERASGVLDVDQVREIARLAREVAAALDGPQDVEWALDGDGTLWLLQARPVTTGAPASSSEIAPAAGVVLLTGTAASRGRATGRARVLASPAEHQRFSPGEVLVCRTTDPSWVPLMAVASAVVTEVGGLLAHAAIVARELGVPAVVGVPDATRRLAHEPVVTVDGGRGEVAPAP